MRGVDGDALGTLGRDRVAEVDVVGDIWGRQHDGGTDTVPEALGNHRSVGSYVGDAPPIAVADPAATQRPEAAVVLSRDDEVAHRCSGAVAEFGLPAGQSFAVQDPLGAG